MACGNMSSGARWQIKAAAVKINWQVDFYQLI
jgi:hypothetical protein